MNPTPDHDDPSTARTDEGETLARIAAELAALDEAPLSEAELVEFGGRDCHGDAAVARGASDVALVETLVRLAAPRHDERAAAASSPLPPEVARGILSRVEARLDSTIASSKPMSVAKVDASSTQASRSADVLVLRGPRRSNGVVVLLAVAAAIAVTVFVVRDRMAADLGALGASGDDEIAALGRDAREALQALGYDPKAASARLDARASVWADALDGRPSEAVEEGRSSERTRGGAG